MERPILRILSDYNYALIFALVLVYTIVPLIYMLWSWLPWIWAVYNIYERIPSNILDRLQRAIRAMQE